MAFLKTKISISKAKIPDDLFNHVIICNALCLNCNNSCHTHGNIGGEWKHAPSSHLKFRRGLYPAVPPKSLPLLLSTISANTTAWMHKYDLQSKLNRKIYKYD